MQKSVRDNRILILQQHNSIKAIPVSKGLSDKISKDLKKVLPEVKSFSPRNLLYMHQFYRLFPPK